MPVPKKFYGIEDARSMRGILSRGHARYGAARAPKPGSLFNVQKAAQKRIKNLQDKRRLR